MIFTENSREYPSHFFDAGDGSDPFAEICALAVAIHPDVNVDMLREIHYDIVDTFTGKSPYFKHNTMCYHNLRHTMMVALAAMRLLHGLHCEGYQFDQSALLQGMLCAYFHDVGMLIKRGDPTTNASFYIPIHEQRSAFFLKEYVEGKGWPEELVLDTDVIIAYTWLRLDPIDFRPHSKQKQILGQVVGAADLFAQMGDRYYLEALPLLFLELERGGLNMYEDVMALLENTADFFKEVVEIRLVSTYRDVFGAMQTHFFVQQGIDKNLYMESINKNLQYLTKILKKCPNIECVNRYLRRNIPMIG